MAAPNAALKLPPKEPRLPPNLTRRRFEILSKVFVGAPSLP